ncbi:LysR family transcriptional regulator [Chengkuizengella axinellae]|uniref:LysR family transcriptional regulator n=1 Tax=Chengkuizengella axinellae TaxID=3064388 RepID=A0ABT9J071_9BACL|nr:LysR family transcriptional regulator [Chengkuizengella sp. 2205SS18-9]MDP5274425.1 LysR family transcriptional regulator [Chengkuizengella sp. 2205SS18-9]
MDFKQLEAFQAVLDEGSYSDAAKNLFVSQPTITVRLKALQDELGVALFQRYGRKVKPTLAGRILAYYVSDILNLHSNAVQAIQDTKQNNSKTLKISTTSTGTYVLPPITKGFQESYENTRISLSISNVKSAVTQLREQKTDLAVITSPIEKNELSSVIVGEDALVLAAHSDHPLAGKKNVSIKDLKNECFIIREQGSDTRQQFELWCHQNHFYPNNYIEIDQPEAIRISVLNHVGLAVMSKFIVQSESKFSSLSILDVEGFPIHRYVQVLMQPDKQEDVLTQAFVQYLKEKLSTMS